jgi:hypothetical protein
LWLAGTAAWAGQALTLTIDAQPAGTVLVVHGKRYVAIDALKAAGVCVSESGSTVALTLPGRTVAASADASIGAWQFNGIWSFRVLSVARRDPATDGAGWTVAVEIRNDSKFGGTAPAGTGWQGVTLLTDDGSAISAGPSAAALRDTGLAQGAVHAQTLVFETDSARKPVRLVLRFDPKGLEGAPQGMRFTVPDPSFSVDLRSATPGGGN